MAGEGADVVVGDIDLQSAEKVVDEIKSLGCQAQAIKLDVCSSQDVNLKGQFLCSQVVGRQMIEQKRGEIINIASVAGHRGVSTSAAYFATKGGVLALTRTLAVNWAKYNINVN